MSVAYRLPEFDPVYSFIDAQVKTFTVDPGHNNFFIIIVWNGMKITIMPYSIHMISIHMLNHLLLLFKAEWIRCDKILFFQPIYLPESANKTHTLEFDSVKIKIMCLMIITRLRKIFVIAIHPVNTIFRQYFCIPNEGNPAHSLQIIRCAFRYEQRHLGVLFYIFCMLRDVTD